MATTVLPIVKVTVSAKGVAAAILEDNTASYIYFYRKDGTEIKIFIKGVLGGISDILWISACLQTGRCWLVLMPLLKTDL